MNTEKVSNQDLLPLIKDTFSIVNQKIDGLIDCSVKDFVLLNTIFQDYHTFLGSISGSTNNFLNFFTSKRQDKDIETLCNQKDTKIISLNKSIKEQLSKLKDLGNKLSFLLLHISNLKQDLSTLQLLFTNLRFDPSLKINQQNIHDCFYKLSENYRQYELSINNIFDKLHELINFSEEGYRNGLEIYSDIVTKIKNQLLFISSIRDSSKRYDEQLKSIDEKKASSTSEIITNLQFQDILRQKIEHIQEAHGSITHSLYDDHKTGSKLNSKEVYQICEISSLQAAQLIHANKEYQSAVEIILRKISELKQVVNSYQSIWGHFCKPEQTKLQGALTKISEDLSLLQAQSFSLNQISDKYLQLLNEQSQLFEKFSTQLNEDKENCYEIKELETIAASIVTDKNNTQRYNPAQQLIDEIKKFKDGYLKLLKLFYNINQTTFNEFIEDFARNDELIKEVLSSSTEINNLIIQFNSSAEKSISKDVLSPPNNHFSVEQVAYYKTFEKEVKEIISLLDDLLTKTGIDRDKFDSEGIKQLRELYTMQSERDVHDKVLDKEHKKEKDKPDSDNDEIEFF